jgi:hypothetical protein
MLGPVTRAYRSVEKARPLVRPTYNDLEVLFLPPFGDPEVNIPGEVAAYLAALVLWGAVTDRLQDV